MLSNTLRELFNRFTDNGTAYKYKFGDLLSNNLGMVVGTYDFSKQGGAVGSFSLKDRDGNPVKLPTGALILNAFAVVRTAVTSGGSATIALTAESAADLLAATAISSFSAAAKLQGVPDFGTLADSVATTAERTLTATVAVAALTAGKFDVYCFYTLPNS